MKRRGDDIADRLLELAVAVLALTRDLTRDVATRHVVSQLVRCATSIGANYEEARGAQSRADFIHKICIAAKEARETRYWVRLLHRSDPSAPGLQPILREVEELLAILIAAARTAQSRAHS